MIDIKRCHTYPCPLAGSCFRQQSPENKRETEAFHYKLRDDGSAVCLSFYPLNHNKGASNVSK